ncbi:RNA polymerase subunit sigma [Paenibacillus sp. CAA11]|uniref:sigma-70 family RNA polymerase sigma factor n=1 Tax=Paenibacillus sp. CAA11 TaxID=1532905 RepID=UPI000D355548|nr:sigma-70 family RNA polymerase sigma factor [Paenibacillus sp. CAA11]AWB44806.1 RNA polymerase subunit sigma [Paenibacillus sp. CAA11]
MLEQQVQQAQQGKQAAFNWLNREFTPLGMITAYRRLNDYYLAEDAVQEAWTEVYQHLAKLKEPGAFPSWYLTIVRRQCNRLLRKKQLAVAMGEDALDRPVMRLNPAEIALQNELKATVHRYIGSLPEKLGNAVLLFHIFGYSLAETAAHLEIPLSTLKKRLYDARNKLKISLPAADLLALPELIEQGGRQSMLHIVNGDVVAEKLRDGRIKGEILVWRELYTEGPHFSPSEPVKNLKERGRYLEQELGIPMSIYEEGCRSQEQVLQQFVEEQKGGIILWFEYDLFDQTMLMLLLHKLEGLGTTSGKQLPIHLLSIGEYPGIEPFHGFGQLSSDQLMKLSGTWTQLGPEDLQAGRLIWEAYISSDPLSLQLLLDQQPGKLPFSEQAFRFHLSRFPSVYNGLGIVEQTLLSEIAKGTVQLLELFRKASDKLRWLGFSDLQAARELTLLAKLPSPLIEIQGNPEPPKFGSTQGQHSFWQTEVSLTSLGELILQGKRDAVEVRGINKYLGGVHLISDGPMWRWDDQAGCLRTQA